MQKTRVWRYNCDFCGRKGYSSGHMRRHEEGCTMNPDRQCNMCGYSEYSHQPIEKLISILNGYVERESTLNMSDFTFYPPNNNEYILKLFDGTTDCPACILAAIRQSKREGCSLDEDGYSSFSFGFDFSEAKKQFWRDHPVDDFDY